MSTYGKILPNKRVTPQQEKASALQKKNNAGGYSFSVDIWKQLERFLILGSEGGTYYVSESKLVRQNVKCLRGCLDLDAKRTIDLIVDVSVKGRAPKNDPAIFALALAVCEGSKGDSRAGKELALAALPKVCRTATHLFQWISEYEALGGGWGRSVTRAVASWYLDKDADSTAFQIVKYQNREGWSHADVFRRCHPRATTPAFEALIRWVIDPERLGEVRKVMRKHSGVQSVYPAAPVELPRIVDAFMRARHLKERSDLPALLKLIREDGLPRECIPTESLQYPEVWEALLEHMPLGALVRNLGKMSNVGILGPMSAGQKKVVNLLGDGEAIRKARLHPMNILIALRAYASGHGRRGSLDWKPNQKIVDALDDAFYLSFNAIEPTGKRHYLAIDVSGSMDADIGDLGITCREAAAAMAMVTARIEPESVIYGFCHKLVDLRISSRDRLDTVTKKVYKSDFGGTDCAQPMLHALEEKIPVDGFFVYTDSETWAGAIHPHQALTKYRDSTGIASKSVVVGMVANKFTIADPSDAGMMDVVGFDTSVPPILADFMR